MKRNKRRPSVKVTTGGAGIVNHAGARLLCEVADVTGLTRGLSAAMAPTKQRNRGHDRGEVLVDVAVSVADGGETISDLAVLRDQPQLFGEVASTPTAWRTLEAVDEAALARVATARAEARARAWEAGADPGFYVVDIDATLIGSHSEKEGAAPTYKRGFGFHPLVAFLDATGEALAGLLRPGNAGSGTAVDHVTVLDAALAQLPVNPEEVEVIARTDSAGMSHGFRQLHQVGDLGDFSQAALLAPVGGDRRDPVPLRSACEDQGFLDSCRDRHVRYVIGHRLTVDIATDDGPPRATPSRRPVDLHRRRRPPVPGVRH